MTARIVQRLTAPGFLPPPRRDDGVAVDIATWVAALSPDLEQLTVSLLNISEAHREVVRTQEAKNRAVEEFERIYGRCSRFLEALYEVAGRDYLAQRLRPSSGGSKPKPQTSEDDSPPDAEPTQDETEPPGPSGQETAPDPPPEPPIPEVLTDGESSTDDSSRAGRSASGSV